MDETSKTLSSIEACLARLAADDQSAWNDLFTHAFDRLLAQCERIVGQQLSKPNPMITKNAVLAEAYQRLCKAMENEKVNPTTAREFFGLAARNIRWQIQDMVRKPASQQEDDMLVQVQGQGPGVATQVIEREKWELFWDAVETLSEEEREVFDLRWVNGLSQYETADLIGKTRNQVDTIWRRIKMTIAKRCKDFVPFKS